MQLRPKEASELREKVGRLIASTKVGRAVKSDRIQETCDGDIIIQGALDLLVPKYHGKIIESLDGLREEYQGKAEEASLHVRVRNLRLSTSSMEEDSVEPLGYNRKGWLPSSTGPAVAASRTSLSPLTVGLKTTLSK